MDEEIVQPTTHNHAAPASALAITHIPRIENEGSDDRRRATWLTKAVLDVYEGLISTASFMIGNGAVKKDAKTILLGGSVGLVAGAFTMMIKKFLYVKTQRDIEHAQSQRRHTCIVEMQRLPNPYSIAFVSAVAFSFGASVPLVSAAFLEAYELRLGVVAAVISVVLIVLGGLTAAFGDSPWLKSSFRVLIGGLLAVALISGQTILTEHFFSIPNTL